MIFLLRLINYLIYFSHNRSSLSKTKPLHMAAQFPRRNYPELLPLIASRWPVEGFRSSISYRVNLISGKLETAHKGEKGEVFRRDRGGRGDTVCKFNGIAIPFGKRNARALYDRHRST